MKIASLAERRCYEPLGMTTALWRTIVPESVSLDQLVLQQDTLDAAALIEPGAPLFDDHPHVVVWHGRSYVDDGHHRIVRAAILGQTHIAARVLWVRAP